MLQVSNDFFMIVSYAFSVGWRIATAFQIPGTNINIPEFCLAMAAIIFSLRHVLAVTGVNHPVKTDSDEGDHK